MRETRAALVFLALTAASTILAACGGDEPSPLLVGFSGRVIDDDSNGIANTAVRVTDRAGQVLSASSTAADGRFFAGGLEKNIPVAMIFSGDPSFVRTVFTGETEERDSLLFTGAVFQRRVAGQQDVIAEFTTAAAISTAALMTFDYTQNTSGAMVRGRVVRMIPTQAGPTFYNVPGATVSIVDGAGTPARVFYRGSFPDPNPDGSQDPGPIEAAATETGEDARFVAFRVMPVVTTGTAQLGFPSGEVTVSVTTDDGTFTEQSLVVEDGLTVFDLFVVP